MALRVVVDTNIFVSAGLKATSWPAEAIRWVSRNGTLLKSDSTAGELLHVMARPRLQAVIPDEFRAGVASMLQAAEQVAIVEDIRLCRDPADDRFLALAVNGRADVLVSGDHDLLTLASIRGIPIVTASAFCFEVMG